MAMQRIDVTMPDIDLRMNSVFTFVVFMMWSYAAFAVNPAVSERLYEKIEQLHATHHLVIGDSKIIGVRIIHDFYSRRNFEPAWNDHSKIEELLEIIRDSADEGLDPEDYSLSDLENLHTIASKSTEQLADFDILLSDSLLRLGFQSRFGKVDPNTLDPNWNFSRDIEGKDPAIIMQAAINSDSIREFIDSTLQRQPFYQRFKTALMKYNSIKAQGGWPVIPEGQVLKPGMDDQRMLRLRARLKVTGDLSGSTADNQFYFDQDLENAVTQFQQRHGLEADGKVGRQTLAAMNTSVEERINQIRVNLERARWLLKDLQGDYIVVNIAGYQAFLIRNGVEVWRTKVMVGKTFRQTPVFKSQMKYLVFNPTWTIPPGILRADILPKARKDPEFVRKKGYHVLDRQGRRVDYDSIDWSHASVKNFPYIIRQPAGPSNALGQIKFIFPNHHFVFLHDTNHRSLFSQPERAFSSGCIRVEHPLTLAELILNNSKKWNQESIQKAIQTGNTRTVHLEKPLTVLLLYWTFMVDEDGTIRFMKDIYQRDQKILNALQSEFIPSAPENLPSVYQ